MFVCAVKLLVNLSRAARAVYFVLYCLHLFIVNLLSFPPRASGEIIECANRVLALVPAQRYVRCKGDCI